MTSRRRILSPFQWKLLGLALLALAVIPLDIPISNYFHGTPISKWVNQEPQRSILRAPGMYYLELITAVLLFALHPRALRAAALMVLTGLPGIFVWLIKWVAGRSRPFRWSTAWKWDPFREGFYGLFHQTDLGFVSGDATLAFAWATAMTILVPRGKWFWYFWALVTAVQRVVQTAHYPTDVIAGSVLGTFSVIWIQRILMILFPLPATDEPTTNRWNETMRWSNFGAELKTMSEENAPYVSLVIPCYNEEENVPTLLKRVADSMSLVGQPFEVVIVDDGSSDKTPELLEEGKKQYPWLRIVRMKKNSGQSAGFEAGFAAARGKYIATIDADLQNDPEEVPRLLKLLEESPDIDMVNGWRKDRQDTNFRRWQSRQANRIRNWISQDNINDSACSLKVYRAHTLKGLKLFNGAHRFFPALVKMRGYKVLEVPVKHSQRFAGTAKYGFRNRAMRAFVDLLAVRWMKTRYLRYEAEEKTGA